MDLVDSLRLKSLVSTGVVSSRISSRSIVSGSVWDLMTIGLCRGVFLESFSTWLSLRWRVPDDVMLAGIDTLDALALSVTDR